MRRCAVAGQCWSSGQGYIAQWLERLTADQQVPGSNPGVPFVRARDRCLKAFRAQAACAYLAAGVRMLSAVVSQIERTSNGSGARDVRVRKPRRQSTRGGTRTHNLLLRREAPYPLGHTSLCMASHGADAWPSGRVQALGYV